MVKRLLPGSVRRAGTGEGENFAVTKDGELNILCDRGRRCAAMWVFQEIYKMYYPTADINRIYVKGKKKEEACYQLKQHTK